MAHPLSWHAFRLIQAPLCYLIWIWSTRLVSSQKIEKSLDDSLFMTPRYLNWAIFLKCLFFQFHPNSLHSFSPLPSVLARSEHHGLQSLSRSSQFVILNERTKSWRAENQPRSRPEGRVCSFLPNEWRRYAVCGECSHVCCRVPSIIINWCMILSFCCCDFYSTFADQVFTIAVRPCPPQKDRVWWRVFWHLVCSSLSLQALSTCCKNGTGTRRPNISSKSICNEKTARAFQ
jgi:hypothetical protein